MQQNLIEQYKNIPNELKSRKQWVCYKIKPRGKSGKFAKLPKNPFTGGDAKSNDTSTWSDFHTAVNAVKKYNFDGIGIQLADGIFGIDLDGVVKDGKFSKVALDIIHTMDSYTEYSPSGTGIHILCKGTIPPKDRRNGNVEMYSEGRFFTVTGKVLGSKNLLQERTAQAKEVHKKYISRVTKSKENQSALPPTDTELLQRAFEASNGDAFRSLWYGDISNYDSRSEADLALCNYLAYWTNGDEDRMHTLFKHSGLYRDKWNENHGDDTYGSITIRKALEDFKGHLQNEHNKIKESIGNENSHKTDNNTDELQHKFSNNLVSNYITNELLHDINNFKKYENHKTGFKNLDNLSGGIYPGLYVIGAITSLGKTTFIHQITDNLAHEGNHVLFFSLEQSRLEMVTKSLSRITAKYNKSTAVSALDIRKGKTTPEVIDAINQYKETADLISIIECNFNITLEKIVSYVEDYQKVYNIKPIVIIDYLQIIPPTNSRLSDKANVDNIVRGLKRLQSENNLVVFVISSINRTNYLTPIDFESFKESGGIEYTADVVWGLQLQVINDDIFNKDKNLKEKREIINNAKKEIPRKIELVCLKNRHGISSYRCNFKYDPRYDLFEPDYDSSNANCKTKINRL